MEVKRGKRGWAVVAIAATLGTAWAISRVTSSKDDSPVSPESVSPESVGSVTALFDEERTELVSRLDKKSLLSDKVAFQVGEDELVLPLADMSGIAGEIICGDVKMPCGLTIEHLSLGARESGSVDLREGPFALKPIEPGLVRLEFWVGDGHVPMGAPFDLVIEPGKVASDPRLHVDLAAATRTITVEVKGPEDQWIPGVVAQLSDGSFVKRSSVRGDSNLRFGIQFFGRQRANELALMENPLPDESSYDWEEYVGRFNIQMPIDQEGIDLRVDAMGFNSKSVRVTQNCTIILDETCRTKFFVEDFRSLPTDCSIRGVIRGHSSEYKTSPLRLCFDSGGTAFVNIPHGEGTLSLFLVKEDSDGAPIQGRRIAFTSNPVFVGIHDEKKAAFDLRLDGTALVQILNEYSALR